MAHYEKSDPKAHLDLPVFVFDFSRLEIQKPTCSVRSKRLISPMDLAALVFGLPAFSSHFPPRTAQNSASAHVFRR